MKNKVFRATGIVSFFLAAFITCQITTVRGSGFIDFSDLAKQIMGIIAAVLLTASVMLWRTERAHGKIIKLVLWLIFIAVIAFAVFGGQYYTEPAKELIYVEASVIEVGDALLIAQTTSDNAYLPSGSYIEVPTQNAAIGGTPEAGDRVKIVYVSNAAPTDLSKSEVLSISVITAPD